MTTKKGNGYHALAASLIITAALAGIGASNYTNQRHTPNTTTTKNTLPITPQQQTLDQRLASNNNIQNANTTHHYNLFRPEPLPQHAPLPFYGEITHTIKTIAPHFKITNEQQFAALMYATTKNESSFRKNAVSHKGARGVMQIMPHMERQVNRLLNNILHQHTTKRTNPYDVKANFMKGSYLLADAYTHWAGIVGPENAIDYAIMEFNTGRTNVEQNNIPQETKKYQQLVKTDMNTYYNILAEHNNRTIRQHG